MFQLNSQGAQESIYLHVGCRPIVCREKKRKKKKPAVIIQFTQLNKMIRFPCTVKPMMRDRPLLRPHFCLNPFLIHVNEALTKDHCSFENNIVLFFTPFPYLSFVNESLMAVLVWCLMMYVCLCLSLIHI